MNRKVILISGDGGNVFNSKDVLTFASKLQQKDNVDLLVVGNGEQTVTINDIMQSLDTINQEQEVTIIIQSHGKFSDKFYFLLGDSSSISSKELFSMIKSKLGNKPIDIFTQACHGGGMLIDKEELAAGSTLVSLTSKDEVNIGINYTNMIEQFEQFSGDVTAYNLLEFYLLKFLKNRHKPFIAVSGQPTIFDLDSFLSNGKSKNIIFDSEHFVNLGEPPRYLEVSEKMRNLRSEYDIYAIDYGIAMDICLNDLKNKGLILENNKSLDSNRTR